MRTLLFAVLIGLFGCAACAQTQNAAEAQNCDALQKQVEDMHQRLQDWPQLGRYHEDDLRRENAHMPGPDVIFLGDSITDGWKLDEYFPKKNYVNRGISGQTTPQMLVRMRPDVLDLQPKSVLILAGTNDLAGNTGPQSTQQIEENYASIAELARAHKLAVIFASVLPVSDYGPRPMTQGRPPEKIRELNDWLKKYTADNHFVYLDYYSHMTDDKGMLRKELSEDGLHPNAEGYKVMAPLAQQAIDQALKGKR